MTKGKKKPNIMPRQKNIAKTARHIKRGERVIPIVRVIPEDVPLHFSDGLMIQHKDGMFIVSFLQTQYPLATSPEEITDLDYVEQRCVARVVIAPNQMAKNIGAFNGNFKYFLEQQSEDVQKYLLEMTKEIVLSGEADKDSESDEK